MIEENKHIDNLFREKLKDFSVAPPPEIWEGIRAGLPVKEKKFILPVYWRVAAGIAILASIGTGIFLSTNREAINTVALKEQRIPAPEQGSIPVNDPKTEEIIEQKSIDSKTSARPVPEMTYTPAERPSIAQITQKPSITAPSPEGSPAEYPTAGRLSAYWFILPKQLKPEAAVEGKIIKDRQAGQVTWEMIHALHAVEEEVTEHKDLEIAALASPIYAFRDVSGDNSGIFSSSSSMEKGILSYAGGMHLGYPASERLTIYAGLAYSRMGVKVEGLYSINSIVPGLEMIDPQKIYAGNVFYSSNSIGTIESTSVNGDFVSSNRSEPFFGHTVTNSSDQLFTPVTVTPENRNLSQFFHYLEIPLMLKYKLIDREIDVNLLSGLSSNFLVGNKIILDSNGEKSVLGETGNIRSQNFSGNLGIGFDYNISSTVLLSMEPQFRYYLNSINNPSLISSKPFSFGLFSGVRFIF
jgi:hypothetical protein